MSNGNWGVLATGCDFRPLEGCAVLPRYPVFAREGGIQGTVQVRVLVDRGGKVAAVGRVRGQSVFHQAVKEAVEEWEFYPAMQGTLAVETWVTLPFSFEL